MNRTIEIFTCYHKPYEYAESDVIVPIHVGKARSSVSLPMQGDDEGDNISEKNPHFCELTALYWAWKNSKADAIGLFHYRRFLNFMNRKTTYKTASRICEKFRIDSKAIAPLLDSCDMILPAKNHSSRSIYERYRNAHIIDDLDMVMDIIKEDYPDMYVSATNTLASKSIYFGNILIAHRELFDEYCEWLFDILFKIEKKIHENVLTRDPYQQRVYGFLSERLLTIFVNYKQQTQGIRIIEKPTLFIEDQRPVFRIEKNKDKTRWYLLNIQIFKIKHLAHADKYYVLGIPVFSAKKK